MVFGQWKYIKCPLEVVVNCILYLKVLIASVSKLIDILAFFIDDFKSNKVMLLPKTPVFLLIILLQEMQV